MKHIREKFSENPLERIMFYLVFAVGMLGGIQVIATTTEMTHIWVAIFALLFCARAACNLIWWFGDHPEE